MQGEIRKRHKLFSAPPDFIMGITGFIVQYPFTETLENTLLLKFRAIRFRVLTSYRKVGSTSPFCGIIQTTFSNAKIRRKFFEKISEKYKMCLTA